MLPLMRKHRMNSYIPKWLDLYYNQLSIKQKSLYLLMDRQVSNLKFKLYQIFKGSGKTYTMMGNFSPDS